MGTLSPEEEAKLKKELKEEFDKIDTDKSGMIDKKEFKVLIDKVVKNAEIDPPKDEDFDEMFKEFDKDNSGKITFDVIFKEWTAFSLLIGLAKK